MMGGYLLTERADADLLDIYVFGAKTFGREQALRYQFDLEDCFQRIADNPRMGRLRRASVPMFVGMNIAAT
jgi:toxin ParE1/3/4